MSNYWMDDAPIPESAEKGSIRLVGDAVHSICIPQHASGRALPDFLRTEASDRVLLGTDTYRRVLNGGNGITWECEQPPVRFLMRDVQPVFTEEILRPLSEDLVTVNIVDAEMRVPTAASNIDQFAGNVLSRAKMSGANELSWTLSDVQGADNHSWILTSCFALRIDLRIEGISLPRSAFVRLGSSVVRNTCNKRVSAHLADIRSAYELWALEASTDDRDCAS